MEVTRASLGKPPVASLYRERADTAPIVGFLPWKRPTLTELPHRTMKVRVAHESGAKMMHAFRPICLGLAKSILIDGKASLATVDVDLLTDQTLPRISCRDPAAAFQGRVGRVRFGRPGQNNDHRAVGADGYRRVAQILPLAPHRARCGARLTEPCLGLAPQAGVGFSEWFEPSPTHRLQLSSMM